MGRDSRVIRRTKLISALMVGIVAATVTLLFTLRDGTRADTIHSYVNFEQGWTDDNGDPVNLSKIRGEGSYHNTIPAMYLDGRSLCFRSKNVDLWVYVEGELLYQYVPSIPSIYGFSYGKMYHTIVLPRSSDDLDVMIRTSPEYDDTKVYLMDIRLQQSSDYMMNQMGYNMMNFLVCFVMLVVGVGMTVGASALTMTKRNQLEILTMGIFSIVAALWTATETMVLQSLTMNPSSVHFLNYIMLIILPVPTMLFVASMTNRLEKLPVMLMILASGLNLAANIILSILGIKDYHTLLPVTHGLLGVAVILSFCYIVKSAMNREISKNKIFMLLAAFFSVLLCGTIDLLRYYILDNAKDTAMFFRLGLAIFVFIVGMHEVRELMHYAQYEKEARLMYDLAHKDVLTGLYNRTAYSELEDVLKKAESGSGQVILFDINNLKTVNDVYGHEEGDKHIRKAGEFIKRSFGRYGNCYRIGGDEFFVLIEDPGAADKVDDAAYVLDGLVKMYNERDVHPVPLHIAWGAESYRAGKENAVEAQRRADEKMYRRKKAMKDTDAPAKPRV